jgi:hypothetical protein
MATARPKARVFISHSHQDDELVRDLVRRLLGARLEPVVDLAGLPFNTDWKATVREQIRSAEAMLILVTPAALNSGWIMRELGMAEGLELLVVPVTAGVKPRDLRAPLQDYQVTPFDEADGAIKMLSKRLTPAAKE